MKGIILPVAAGIGSGLVSAFSLQVLGEHGVYWAPGLVFGVVFGCLMVRESGVSVFRAGVWGLLSVAAYRIAVFTGQLVLADRITPAAREGAGQFWYAGVAAGLVGGALLVGSTWLLRLRPADLKSGGIVVGIAAAAGLAFHFWPVRIMEDFHLGPYVLFVAWQAAVGAALMRFVFAGGEVEA